MKTTWFSFLTVAKVAFKFECHRRNSNFKWFLKDFEDAVETDIVDFITGLFWILESKRREFLKSSNNNDKLPFYCAPFEKKDFVGLDLESRSNKKRTYGRFRKHLG